MEKSNLILGRTEGLNKLLLPVVVDDTGHLQIDLLSLPPIPAGADRIGSVGIEGYYSGAWRKAPIPFGAASEYSTTANNQNLPAGTSSLSLPALTANAFTVITSWCFRYTGTVTNVVVFLYITRGGVTDYILKQYISLTSALYYTWDGFIVCKSSDVLKVVVTGATLNDDLYSHAHGYYYPVNL